MKLIVGLGNPGEKYKYTRHNTGFIWLDEYAMKKDLVWVEDNKSKSLIVRDGDLILAKPQTFMNESGNSVSQLVNYYKITPRDLLVIHDDVDLEFGKIKRQSGGSSAGHHGVEDIINKLGTNSFERLRVGIGRPDNGKFDVLDWVLSSFSEDELHRLKAAVTL